MNEMEKVKEDFNDCMRIKESIEKAVHDCGFLRDDISAAYSVACVKNPVLAILLYDLIGELAKVQNRINEIKGVV